MVTNTIVILWLSLATTKGMEWHAVQTFDTVAHCAEYARSPQQVDQFQGKHLDRLEWKCLGYTKDRRSGAMGETLIP
jgi:hypothetical protein